jgi:ubiquitin carboxyl-terminal hydrolase 7
VGLRNQGNTCYMNSLLQSLHHLPEFRKIIYSIPTDIGNASTPDSVPLELQRVFFELEHAEEAGAAEVGTERLTRSFGWGRREVMVQQDVQEFARLLCDSLQEAMRSRGVDDGVAELFEGRTASVTRCTRVKFESEKVERFYDLQLQVQGCSGVHHALREFVREDRLTGDNKYNTRDPELGRQDARRSVRFKQLPPVLQLHLKRFEFDAHTGGLQKLQQSFAFPTTLKLHRYLARGAALGAPPPVYVLHAVLSHAGDADSGHYIAYVRPRGGKDWYEFDDTRVSKVPEEVAVRQQFGGRHSSRGRGLFGLGEKPNAYMLMYVRRDVLEHTEEQPESSGLLSAEVRAAFENAMRRDGASAGGAAARGAPAGFAPDDAELDRLFG